MAAPKGWWPSIRYSEGDRDEKVQLGNRKGDSHFAGGVWVQTRERPGGENVYM